MPPSISVREYIRWLPDPPSEPTNTTVVTSPQNRFVDLRILKTNPDPKALQGIQTFDTLDWAFAGTSSSEIRADGPDGAYRMHATWKHWIDSRNPDAESVVDEGVMTSLETDGRTLEQGSMVNPATGVMGAYEEVWQDRKLRKVARKDRVKEPGPGPVECVVLQLEGDQGRARGMVVRVGWVCQGIMRVGAEHVTIEQWVYEIQGGWKREVRMGDLFLPCGVAIMEREKMEERVQVGSKVRYGDYEWDVVEMSTVDAS